ncbi:MAG TPA: type II toxin-antitoxin system RelE/ParE family toxin [Terriglobales bacterium]|nr:type II toxin-antitoxin system RelE/ParE family toxin [Terriglobales bacterium]
MKLEITKAAERDLEESDRYWAETAGAAVADRMGEELAKRLLLLTEFPRCGKAVPGAGSGVRCLPSGPYLIFYRIRRGAVQVLHLRHAARHPIG